MLLCNCVVCRLFVKMQFVDAHCHLHFARVARVARPLLQNAKEKGITHFAVNATSPNDFALVCSLAQSDDSVIPFYGVHPYYIQEGTWEHDYAQLVSMKEKLRYIGEIGMDKTIASRIPMAFQASCFRKQVQLAVSLSIPFAVHCVRCVQDVYSVLEEEGPFACPFLMHGYSGSPDYVSKLVALGAYFSISGYFLNVSPKRRKAMDDTIRKIPLDRLLFESDAPDMVMVK